MDRLSQTLVRLIVFLSRHTPPRIGHLTNWVRDRSRSYAARALESYRSGNLNLAETCYREAILWQPEDADLHSALGQVYYEDNQPKEAEKWFRKALDYDYGNLRALKGLGILLQERGDLPQAMYLYLKYLELQPKDAAVCYNLGVVFQSLGKYEKADEYYSRAEKEDPDDLLTRKNHAIALVALGRYEEALATLTGARAIAPNDSQVDYLQGLALEARGQKEAALGYYTSAVGKNPEDADAHLRLAAVESGLGRQQEAEEHAKTALELHRRVSDDHGAAEALAVLGWIRYMCDDLTSSIQASTEALTLNPDLTAVHFNVGLVLLQLGRAAEALKEYEAGIARPDQASDLKVEAIKDLREAIDKNPELAGAKEILGMLQSKYETVSNELARSAQHPAGQGRETI